MSFYTLHEFVQLCKHSSLFHYNYHWSGPLERVLYFSTDFVMFNVIQSYRCLILIDLIDLFMITYPSIIKAKFRMT